MLNYCVDCKKEISYKATKCNSCAVRAVWSNRERRPPNQCIDCGKEIRQTSKRCVMCSAKDPERRQKASKTRLGHIVTDETRAKISNTLKGNIPWNKGKQCPQISRGLVTYYESHEGTFTGRRHTETSKQALSDANRGSIPWNKGRTGVYSEEALQQMSESKRGYCHTREAKQKMREGHLGLKHTQETRDKIGRASKGRIPWIKGRQQTEEARRKISIGLESAWAEGKFDSRKIVCDSPTQPEQDIMTALTGLGIGYEFNTFSLDRYIYDFYLPEYDVLIEYDGWFWHQLARAQKNAKIKNQLAADNALCLIRLKGLRERDLTYDEIYLQLSEELANGSP